MILLAETALPLRLRNNSSVFIRRSGRIRLRHRENGHPSGSQDSIQLGKRGVIVANMLKHIAGDNSVEFRPGNCGHAAYVEQQIAVAAPEIGSDVTSAFFSDSLTKLAFWREVKDVLVPQHSIRRELRNGAIECCCKQTMTDLTATVRTDCSGVPGIIRKGGPLPVADVAIHGIACKPPEESLLHSLGPPQHESATEGLPYPQRNQTFQHKRTTRAGNWYLINTGRSETPAGSSIKF